MTTANFTHEATNRYNDGTVTWCGVDVSEYGIKHGYVDYGCLAKCVGDMVLCNNINQLFYGRINGEYVETELENGSEYYDDNQEEYKDFYQYYIITPQGADFLTNKTNETVWYIEPLNMYVWGITHFGTGWSCVETDIKL